VKRPKKKPNFLTQNGPKKGASPTIHYFNITCGSVLGGRSIFKTRLKERKEIESMAGATGFLGPPLS
jgi:hypothetical protein